MQIKLSSFVLALSLSLWPALAPAIPIDTWEGAEKVKTYVLLYVQDPVEQSRIESLGVHQDPPANPKSLKDTNLAAQPVVCGPSAGGGETRTCRVAFVHKSGNSYSQIVNGVELNFEAEGLPGLPDGGTLSVTRPDAPESLVEIAFPSDGNSIITHQQGVKFGFVDPVW